MRAPLRGRSTIIDAGQVAGRHNVHRPQDSPLCTLHSSQLTRSKAGVISEELLLFVALTKLYRSGEDCLRAGPSGQALDAGRNSLHRVAGAVEHCGAAFWPTSVQRLRRSNAILPRAPSHCQLLMHYSSAWPTLGGAFPLKVSSTPCLLAVLYCLLLIHMSWRTRLGCLSDVVVQCVGCELCRWGFAVARIGGGGLTSCVPRPKSILHLFISLCFCGLRPGAGLCRLCGR